MTWRYDEPDFRADHPPRCHVEGCTKPGRFFMGHGAVMYTWCIDHVHPRGTDELLRLVHGIRDILRDHPPTSTDHRDFAAWMKERREAKELTQSEAARLAGMSRGTWREHELGLRRTPFPKTRHAIERVLE